LPENLSVSAPIVGKCSVPDIVHETKQPVHAVYHPDFRELLRGYSAKGPKGSQSCVLFSLSGSSSMSSSGCAVSSSLCCSQSLEVFASISEGIVRLASAMRLCHCNRVSAKDQIRLSRASSNGSISKLNVSYNPKIIHNLVPLALSSSDSKAFPFMRRLGCA